MHSNKVSTKRWKYECFWVFGGYSQSNTNTQTTGKLEKSAFIFFSNFLSVKIPPKGIYYHIAIAISSIFWFKRSCDTQFFVGSLIHTAKLLGLSTYRWHLRNGVRLRQKLVSIHLIDDLFQFQHIIGPHWNATKSFSVALHFIAIWAKTTKKPSTSLCRPPINANSFFIHLKAIMTNISFVLKYESINFKSPFWLALIDFYRKWLIFTSFEVKSRKEVNEFRHKSVLVISHRMQFSYLKN